MTLVHEAQICCFQSLRARQKLSFSTLSRDSQVKEHRLHCNEGADGSPKTKPTSVIRRCASILDRAEPQRARRHEKKGGDLTC
ncbi:hypothetical protein TGP89_358840 [Toxoplasma gondii p89]|uniref:Uncharacterized protein n=1 Tax=Toxoplasma gondii p89 TaxID=943119 RepID=A0A086KWX3_TOXGO|nr:hypothetical protein TGP89_358840 [Toxoplasma gondii p89]